MALLPILKFPDPRLRTRSQTVEGFDQQLSTLAEAMLATMYAAGGIGLAAPQVGRVVRLVVVDLHAADEDRNNRDPRIYVNPEITEHTGETFTEEGCLSVPQFTAEVKRAEQIVLRYQTLRGQQQEEALDGLGAVCLQHEIDHLEGKLFVDHLSPLKQRMVKKRLAKLSQDRKIG